MADTTRAIKTYRYKFSDVILEEMTKFAKIHSADTKELFKDAWNIWKEDQKPLIERELHRLQGEGYDGNIHDKIYRSIRYYFCKKSNKKQEPKKRRAYISINKEILDKMDNHIKTSVLDKTFKPSIAYNEFIESNNKILENELDTLMKRHNVSKDLLREKLLKTYKNRYFIYRQNLMNKT